MRGGASVVLLAIAGALILAATQERTSFSIGPVDLELVMTGVFTRIACGLAILAAVFVGLGARQRLVKAIAAIVAVAGLVTLVVSSS